MYGNNYGYYNPTRNYGMPTSNQYIGQPMAQSFQPITNSHTLQGKIADSIDVVKALDFPMDGTISYFPIANGSAIVTKQLQNDGTSKTIIYKPIEDTKEELPKYATVDDIDKVREELYELKKSIRDMRDNREKRDKHE